MSVLRSSYRQQNGLCFYCGKFIEFVRQYNKRRKSWDRHWTIDHMDPKSRGGRSDERNKVGCCQNCNSRKANMTVQEFLETDYLPDERRKALGAVLPPSIKFSVAKRQHQLRIKKKIQYPPTPKWQKWLKHQWRHCGRGLRKWYGKIKHLKHLCIGGLGYSKLRSN